MNDILLAVILGVIEGLTEFLPISSTAHLRIAQAALGVNLEDEYWKMFAIVIQLGAILSVVVHFRGRLLALAQGYRFQLKHPVTLTAVAFLVTAIPAFLLSKLIGENLESLVVIGSSLVVGGIVMWVIDRRFNAGQTDQLEKMSLGQAIWIGAVQVLSAVFPGTSRSMSTIAGAQLAGLTRTTALEFSFFVSIPTMMAATGYDLLKTLVLKRDVAAPLVMGSEQWMLLAIGFVTAFAVAWGVIAWFMSWVRNKGFAPFAIYRVLFGAVVLWAATNA